MYRKFSNGCWCKFYSSLWLNFIFWLCHYFLQDFYLAAALTEIAAQALRGSDDSSFSESEFAIFADTEWESDAPDGDPELTRHDYWKCIKCKNNQNNPMYRYCERCYQVSWKSLTLQFQYCMILFDCFCILFSLFWTRQKTDNKDNPYFHFQPHSSLKKKN